MKRLRYVIVYTAIGFVLLAGCDGNQIPVTAGLGEVFTIGVGQSAQIPSEDMEVAFIEVIGDSRCPQNASCVWEGVASSHIEITHEGVDYSIVLNQPGLTEQASETFINYTLTYSLNPYPREGEEIPLKDYLLTLNVTM
jgi:hypothetical protein